MDIIISDSEYIEGSDGVNDFINRCERLAKFRNWDIQVLDLVSSDIEEDACEFYEVLQVNFTNDSDLVFTASFNYKYESDMDKFMVYAQVL